MPKTLPVTPKTRKPGRPAGSTSGEGRESLFRVAQQIMAEKGLPRVTVREVAERAGVRSGLVHYYFGDKDGLLRAVVAAVAAQMVARLQAVASGAGSPEDRVREFVRGMVEAMIAAPYAPRLIVEQVLFADERVVEEFVVNFARPNLAAILAILGDGQASGRFRSVDPRFTVPAMAGACIFFFLGSPLLRRLHEIDAVDAQVAREFAESTAELILHGIAAPGVAST